MVEHVRRVVLKLSGEALGGPGFSGIDLNALFRIAGEIKSARAARFQIAVVVGGGNIWRGTRGQGRGLDRVVSDHMGILSAVEIAKMAEPYIRRRAIRHLEKGRIVVFAAGTGNPYFSTDTAAALRAAEIEAHAVLKATLVDGVYDSDPRKNPAAKRYKTLTLLEALQKRLGVMDATALSLCHENKLPVRVFKMDVPGNIRRAIAGRDIGTLLTP